VGLRQFILDLRAGAAVGRVSRLRRADRNLEADKAARNALSWLRKGNCELDGPCSVTRFMLTTTAEDLHRRSGLAGAIANISYSQQPSFATICRRKMKPLRTTRSGCHTLKGVSMKRGKELGHPLFTGC
jgi:hypothetical protein